MGSNYKFNEYNVSNAIGLGVFLVGVYFLRSVTLMYYDSGNGKVVWKRDWVVLDRLCIMYISLF